MRSLVYCPLFIALYCTNVSAAIPVNVTTAAMGGEHFSSWNEMMIPVRSGQSYNLYTDLQLEGASTDAGIASVGVGYRQAYASSRIWGGYLFVDRERSADKGYYTSIGPGFELLSSTWRYRVNGYFPFNDKKKLTEQGWADELGNYSYEQFSGHEQLDQRAYKYEQISFGGDATIAYRFANDRRWEVGVTPYAYRMSEETDMYGGKAQVSYYVNDHLSYSLSDGYDNKNKNRIIAGVTFSFGGRSMEETTTKELLNTPVYRNLDVNTTDNGLPVDDYINYTGDEEVESDNIYFVTNSGGNQATATTPDGTYENPYTDMDEISGANSSANIWVAGSSTAYSEDSTITLIGTQTLVGRTSDFKRAATGSDRPTITSEGLIITSTNDVSNVILLGDGYNSANTEQAGITVNSASDPTKAAHITNVKIGSTNANTSFQNGVWVNDGANVNIADSEITAYLGPTADAIEAATGVYLDGDGEVTVSNSEIDATTVNDVGTSFGVYALSSSPGSGTVILSNDNIEAIADNGSAYGVGDGFADLTVTNSTVIATAQDDALATAAGFDIYSANANITGNTVTVISNGQAGGVMQEGGPGVVNFSNNTVSAMGDSLAFGYVNSSNAATATVSNNTFAISANESTGSAYGIENPFGGVTYSGNTYSLSGATTANVLYPDR